MAHSWPGSGIIGLYAFSSSMTPSSVMVFSTRIISWIWYRMVSRFSNESDISVPRAMRLVRRFSITVERNASRSRS